MAESYKLLKEFPGSPEAKSVAVVDEMDDSIFEIFLPDGSTNDEFISRESIEEYPDYWELLIPHKDNKFEKIITIHLTEDEYSSMIKLVKYAIKENIFIKSYKEAGDFFNAFEQNNFSMKDIKMQIPVGYVKVLANSMGSIVYSHQKITLAKRKELKSILTKIENQYDYINKKGSNTGLFSLIIQKIQNLF